MSAELSDYKLKCKNHRNFGDGVPSFGFGPTWYAGAGSGALLYLPLFIRYFPKIMANWYHGIISCSDNPHWEYIEKWQQKIYKPVRYVAEIKTMEQIAHEETKREYQQLA